MKVTYYVASSIDGYIAKEDGDVSWLEDLGIPVEETGYEDFFSTVDALVMGRKTYEMIYQFGVWTYGDKPTWVCTTSNLEPIQGCNLQNGSTPQDVYEAAKSQGIKHLWLVGGGSLATSFLEESLLTNISISQMPIKLGRGIKLFDNAKNMSKLERVSLQPHKLGFSQIELIVKG